MYFIFIKSKLQIAHASSCRYWRAIGTQCFLIMILLTHLYLCEDGRTGKGKTENSHAAKIATCLKKFKNLQ